MKRILLSALVAYTLIALGDEPKDGDKAAPKTAPKPLGLRHVVLSERARLSARDCTALGATVIRHESCASGLACYNQPKGESTSYAVCLQYVSQ
jgi:hypothetical protein